MGQGCEVNALNFQALRHACKQYKPVPALWHRVRGTPFAVFLQARTHLNPLLRLPMHVFSQPHAVSRGCGQRRLPFDRDLP